MKRIILCVILVTGITLAMVAGINCKSSDSGQKNAVADPPREEPAAEQEIEPVESPEIGVKQIALTFDDGPHAIYTRLLLDGLKERGVKATFFLMGQNIEGNEELVTRMEEEGHLIGNHTYSHVQISRLSKEQAVEEVKREDTLLTEILGKESSYFRPPFGSMTEQQFLAIEKTVVLWNIDPLDWSVQNKEQVMAHIKSHLNDGPIILLHDIFKPSVEAALSLIDELQEQGYEFVRIDELKDANSRIKIYEEER